MIDGQTSLTDVAHWRQFCLDAAADPTLLDRDPDGILSATLEGLEFARARYERVTNTIVGAFGPLDGMVVCELGAGYGGQALSILSRFPDVRYRLVDLPEPLRLQQKILTGLNVREHQPGERFDLFVSSFALSELRRDLQLIWAVRLSFVPRGFVYWNGWLADQTTLDEFLSPFTDVEVRRCPDNERNRMILWGHEHE